MSLDRVEAFAEMLFEQKIKQEFDRVIPIVADEGMGKSTFMLEFMTIWRQVTGREVSADSLIDQFVYDQEGFQDALAEYPPRSVIPVPDAARALHRKEAMRKGTIETEKDLLDVRVKEHVILLGYQDWNIIPRFLQERRAKNVFYIPKRGRVWGFNRASIDQRYEDEEWPDADFKASFPSLEGTELWRRYKEEDMKRKQDRMRAVADDEEESLEDIVERIKDDGVDNVSSIHGGWNKRILDRDLIEMEYDLSRRDATKVKKLLKSDSSVSVGEDEEPPQNTP